jgi:XisI protein
METLERTSNVTIVDLTTTLERILRSYIDALDLGSEIRVYLVTSDDRNHVMLMHEGWQGDRRLYGAIVHGEIRDGKIWVHYDGTEAGITEELLAAGVLPQQIVLGFQPPYARKHTGYAIG